MKIIQLDGTSGGGQMLRTALTLAMITGQPFRMTCVRGKRRKPGLMRQHLTCVRAACEISGGTVDGAEIGSTEIIFRAGKLRGRLRLEGGTHNPLAPPFEFIDRVFLPALRQMGVEASVSLLESGFAPVGGGIIECEIQPCAKFLPLILHERGALTSMNLRVPIRNLNANIGSRILAAALAQLPCEDAAIETREPGPGRGVCCLYEAQFENTAELASSCGETNVTAERVGRRAAKQLQDFISSQVPVGRHLADQLLLPMALAGSGSFTTIIEKFLPVKFKIEQGDRGRCVIEVESVSQAW
jgi:RNA 3'-terminal phosphate cyclase (ATP)